MISKEQVLTEARMLKRNKFISKAEYDYCLLMIKEEKFKEAKTFLDSKNIIEKSLQKEEYNNTEDPELERVIVNTPEIVDDALLDAVGSLLLALFGNPSLDECEIFNKLIDKYYSFFELAVKERDIDPESLLQIESIDFKKIWYSKRKVDRLKPQQYHAIVTIKKGEELWGFSFNPMSKSISYRLNDLPIRFSELRKRPGIRSYFKFLANGYDDQVKPKYQKIHGNMPTEYFRARAEIIDDIRGILGYEM